MYNLRMFNDIPSYIHSTHETLHDALVVVCDIFKNLNILDEVFKFRTNSIYSFLTYQTYSKSIYFENKYPKVKIKLEKVSRGDIDVIEVSNELALIVHKMTKG